MCRARNRIALSSSATAARAIGAGFHSPVGRRSSRSIVTETESERNARDRMKTLIRMRCPGQRVFRGYLHEIQRVMRGFPQDRADLVADSRTLVALRGAFGQAEHHPDVALGVERGRRSARRRSLARSGL